MAKRSLSAINRRLKSRVAKKERIKAKRNERERIRKENEALRKKLRGY